MRWLWHRLRAMPPGEWWQRATAALRLLLLHLRPAPPRPGDPVAHPKRLTLDPAGLDDSLRDPPERTSIFELELELDPEGRAAIDWHRDPLTGRCFPLRPSLWLDHRDATRYGDVKYVWELNRLQHLVPIALGARLRGELEPPPAVVARIESWQEANPWLRGVNWRSGLELGMRLLSWSQLLFVLPTEAARALFRDRLRAPIYEHGYLLDRFPSPHSSANNHLIGEAVGLYVSSSLWPVDAAAERWRESAKRRLLRAIREQVGDDGVSRELSTGYHAFVSELFLTAGALGSALEDPFPDDYWRRLGSMLDFAAAIRDRRGQAPDFGDNDDATVLALGRGEDDRLGRLLAVTGRSQAHDPAAARLLLWGLDSADLPLPPASPPRADGVTAFPVGGYFALARRRGEEDEMLVVFDAGELGMAPTWAHGHADALSFWLSYGGRELLIDPGTYAYYSHPEWRDYFRGTAAHNTLRLDAENQSTLAGRFLWSRAARCRVESWGDDGGGAWVSAAHDGYERLADPVRHLRTLRLAAAEPTLCIDDRLEGEGRRSIELRFHFAPDCRVDTGGGDVVSIVSGESRLVLTLDPRLDTCVLRGSESPPAGWASPGFGRRRAAPTLVASIDCELPLELRTELSAR